MKSNIWIIVLISVNFAIVSALFSPKVSYNKVSFIKRGEPEYVDAEDNYNEETEYVNITYSTIIDSMSTLSKLNPETTSLIKLGKSCGGLKDILALSIQKPNYNPKFSNTILLTAGIQGDDWQSVFTAFYIAKQLIEYKESLKIMFGINTKWLIIPILNPDLYTNDFQGGDVSKCFKNNNWNRYGKILDKVKEENVTIIIHLNSEKVCSINYSNYLQRNELNAKWNKGNNLAKVLQNESYLICNINIQEPIINNTNISSKLHLFKTKISLLFKHEKIG
ncbi:uncharacterized protein LOC108742541 [Agrilus planipennis]|uniref:Uncharacterized protein LOC108742541 n=1 Tax=Agrilus planipennis TaxID=224129 RepID=A0A1W4XB12_AGRPL|nr:uncharacterized protein LOC108742541 [Agrilus planipennis]XP_018333299.1 uncharacterized protein LOC108742541 [Agrilus planipennis]